MAVIKKSLLELNRHSGRDEVSINLTALRKDGCVFKITALPLHSLTAAAFTLPGLLQPVAYATEEDSIDFQYSHYQEGKREGTYADYFNSKTSVEIKNIPVLSRVNYLGRTDDNYPVRL
ncbi:MAG: DUF3570 domain-containing protein [Methyloglobulus sp.]|nr:DUF3570 domain-containing protein [Methyloglobulus sp.]